MAGKLPLYQARKIARDLIDDLTKLPYVVNAKLTGSARRWCAAVTNINIACAIDPKAAGRLKQWLANHGELQQTQTADHVSLLTHAFDRPVTIDIGLCGEIAYGALIMYMTGSPLHNATLKRLFDTLRMSYLKHGVFSIEGKRLAGPVERDVYRAANYEYHPPEIRENGLYRPLPPLLSAKTLPTVISPATLWSGGQADPEVTIQQAIMEGRRVVVFADSLLKLHERFRPYTRSISLLARAHAHQIKVVCGVRVPIEMDGSTHVPSDSNLDMIVASIDDRPVQPVTRIRRAIKNEPRIRVVTKITGRVLGKVSVPDSPWEGLFRMASTHRIALAVDGSPKRMDPPTHLVKLGQEMGCRWVIDCPDRLTYGLKIARRALLNPRDIATRELYSG